MTTVDIDNPFIKNTLFFILKNIKNLKLIHGIIQDDDNKKFISCWIESNDFVYSYDNTYKIQKTVFYKKYYIINKSYIEEYSKDDIIDLLNQYNNFGPFSKKLINQTNSDYRYLYTNKVDRRVQNDNLFIELINKIKVFQLGQLIKLSSITDLERYNRLEISDPNIYIPDFILNLINSKDENINTIDIKFKNKENQKSLFNILNIEKSDDINTIAKKLNNDNPKGFKFIENIKNFITKINTVKSKVKNTIDFVDKMLF